MSEPTAIPCMTCRHYRVNVTCAAFKAGIPAAILLGEAQHFDPIAGDGGMTYALDSLAKDLAQSLVPLLGATILRL